MNVRSLLKTVTAAACLALVAAIPASASPTTVTFKLVGSHPPDQDYHQGTFTAPAPMCPSGTWQGNGQGTRVFTCADASGTFLRSPWALITCAERGAIAASVSWPYR